jgi:hypothetical protein
MVIFLDRRPFFAWHSMCMVSVGNIEVVLFLVQFQSRCTVVCLHESIGITIIFLIDTMRNFGILEF